MIAATNNEHDIVLFLCNYSGNSTLDLDVKVKIEFKNTKSSTVANAAFDNT